MQWIRVRNVAASDMLVGRSEGRRHFPKFIEAIYKSPELRTVVLDWTGVRIVTASYVAATIVPLLNVVGSGELEKYFVLTKMAPNCEEEIRFVLEAEGLAMFAANRGKRGRLEGVRTLGRLDHALAEALEQVIRHPGASANDLLVLSAGTGKTHIGVTAWINRLSNLHKLRLVRRTRVGNRNTYTIPLEV